MTQGRAASGRQQSVTVAANGLLNFVLVTIHTTPMNVCNMQYKHGIKRHEHQRRAESMSNDTELVAWLKAEADDCEPLEGMSRYSKRIREAADRIEALEAALLRRAGQGYLDLKSENEALATAVELKEKLITAHIQHIATLEKRLEALEAREKLVQEFFTWMREDQNRYDTPYAYADEEIIYVLERLEQKLQEPKA